MFPKWITLFWENSIKQNNHASEFQNQNKPAKMQKTKRHTP